MNRESNPYHRKFPVDEIIGNSTVDSFEIKCDGKVRRTPSNMPSKQFKVSFVQFGSFSAILFSLKCPLEKD